MSVLQRPSTPTTPSSKATPAPSTPVTGIWKHPQLDEITRRQNASTFTDRHVRTIMYNAGGLLVLWVVGQVLWAALPKLMKDGTLHPYATYIYHSMQAILALNIIVAFMPLLRAKDDISDIPLTPAQRQLLGLPPTSKPPSPGSQYVTPPRYARASTPLSGSPGSRPNSPLSGSPVTGSRSGALFSPGATPYLQKAIGGSSFDGSRRHSYGSPSPLGPAGSKVNLQEMPATPSPTTAKGASVGINNRWLFEKGRRNSGNTRPFV